MRPIQRDESAANTGAQGSERILMFRNAIGYFWY
jgi:hypothetical protein